MVVSPRQFSQHWWSEVSKKVKKAVVFIDDEATECLHWNGGLFELISSGAIAVKRFSSFEKADICQKKGVFITASSQVARSKIILQDLIQNSSFDYCVLITAAHPCVYNLAKYGAQRDDVEEMAVFHGLEEDMLHWMGNLNYTVEIFYFPLFLASMTEQLFITPPFQILFPLLEVDVPNIQRLQKQYKGTSDSLPSNDLSGVELKHLPLELQVTYLHLATCVHSLLAYLDVREDIFSLGHSSSLLANMLETLPAAASRRKSANGRCSLVLIDRTLDLATACSHSSESLLDRIMAVLPHLEGQSSDVAVNMSPVCSTKVACVTEDATVTPGCLCHQDEPCPEVMNWLVNRKQKDVLLGLHQLLAAAVPVGTDDRVGRITTRVTPHVLEKQVTAFKGKNDALLQYCGLLQQTLAVTQALKSPSVAQYEQLCSLEKLMFYSLSSSQKAEEVQEQVRRLVMSRQERGLALPHLLALLVYIYSVAGPHIPFSSAEERELQDSLRWALQQDCSDLSSVPLSISKLVPEDADDDTFDSIAAHIMKRLQSIAQARKDLSTYRSLLSVPAENLQDPMHMGLIQRLINDLVDPARPDISDLACRSSGLKELLKSGFSMLLNRPRQQHPLDNPLVIVFVLGGITAQEVHATQEAASEAEISSHLLIGGTCLTSPDKVVQLLFAHDSLLQKGL